MTQTEALKQAISRLEWFIDSYPHDITTSKEDFLRPFKEALAQPEQSGLNPLWIATHPDKLAQPEPVIEIEFLDWVHPQLGVTPVEVEGGKPLILRAKLKEKNT